jgi:hypothetical protein
MTLTAHTFGASMRHDVSTTGPPAPGTENADSDFWGEDGFTFGDFLDIINPLQHIPVVSTLYRAITGDEVSTGARVFGSALLGGAVFGSVAGLFGAVADAMVKETTGKDIGANVLAMLGGPEPDPQDPKPVMVASVSAPKDVRADAAPAPPEAAASDADTGGDDAGTVITPAWLSRIPKAREDYTELVARAGAQTSTDVFLTSMSHGLDKYEQTKITLDRYERGKSAPAPGDATIDTVL